MKTSSTEGTYFNLDLHSTFAVFRSSLLWPCFLNMYSAQHLEVPSKSSLGNVYRRNLSVKMESNIPRMETPKKENTIQHMFSTFTNMIGEQLSKVPVSLMSNINNSLSVTVVHNEGIISHDFFKNLTSMKEPAKSDNLFVSSMESKESLNIIEKVQDSMLDEKQFHIIEPVQINLIQAFESDSALSKFENSDMKSEFCKKELGTKKPVNNETNVKNHFCKSELEENSPDTYSRINLNETEIIVKNMCNMKENLGEDVQKNSTVPIIEFSDDEVGTFSQTQQIVPKEPENLVGQGAITSVLTNMWQKVVSGVTDSFYLRTKSSRVEMYTKKSFSPKQKRKINTVAKGRGRGRARSQLRRSGVSQTRHRKERSKHDIIVDMQDDFDTWQEFEIHHRVQRNDSVDSFSLDENELIVPNDGEQIVQKSTSPVYSRNEAKCKKDKPKTSKIVNRDVPKVPTLMQFVPECAMSVGPYQCNFDDKKYDITDNAFRPRLMSESSVDSEDSYCIVFEIGSEADSYQDDDYEISYETSDEDEESETELNESTQKVKFNLKPVVHTMIQWDYAYRAARKGPWEEMARDRERFKGRINCIGRILDPILSSQHRTRVWQERFAVEE